MLSGEGKCVYWRACAHRCMLCVHVSACIYGWVHVRLFVFVPTGVNMCIGECGSMCSHMRVGEHTHVQARVQESVDVRAHTHVRATV